ncbi:unnamed protein product [Auanema sp. JU1783]|nr:unnamed protein product [Auanema sp. JU1783]
MFLSHRLPIIFLLLIISSTAYVNYNEEEAKLFLNLAAAAYPANNASDMREECVKKTFPDDTFAVFAAITTPCDKRNNSCQAFSSVSNKTRRIILSFRGTDGTSQLYQEMTHSLRDYPYYNETDDKGNVGQIGRVNKYFLTAMNVMWDVMVEPLLPLYPNYTFIVTGHSLGGAMAALAAFRLSYRKVVENPYDIRLITFGEPREGDYEYAQIFQQYVPYSFRIVHYTDPVPHLPPLDELNITLTGYPFHHTREIWYDNKFTSYTICNTTWGEDENCSDRKKFWSYGAKAMKEHLWYFNHYISVYGWNGCNSSNIISNSTAFFLFLYFLF